MRLPRGTSQRNVEVEGSQRESCWQPAKRATTGHRAWPCCSLVKLFATTKITECDTWVERLRPTLRRSRSIPAIAVPPQTSACGTSGGPGIAFLRLGRYMPSERRLLDGKPTFHSQSILYAPRTRDAHRSPWGHLGPLPGPLRGRSSTARCCCRQHSRKLFRYLNCPGWSYRVDLAANAA